MTIHLLETDSLENDNGLPMRTVVADGRVSANQLSEALQDEGLLPEGMQIRVSHLFAVKVADSRMNITHWEAANQDTPGARMVTFGTIRKQQSLG